MDYIKLYYFLPFFSSVNCNLSFYNNFCFANSLSFNNNLDFANSFFFTSFLDIIYSPTPYNNIFIRLDIYKNIYDQTPDFICLILSILLNIISFA